MKCVVNEAGTYLVIDHEWKYGDLVEMQIDMPTLAHTFPEKKPQFVAFTRGPILLARDNYYRTCFPIECGVWD